MSPDQKEQLLAEITERIKSLTGLEPGPGEEYRLEGKPLSALQLEELRQLNQRLFLKGLGS